MAGWWRKDPYFVRYMIREGSAVFLSLYAFMLLAGIICLARGEAAYNAWRAVLAHPLSIALHAIVLAFVAYHAWTWFKVMPKTTPDLPVPQKLIVAGGLTASAVLSLALFGFAWWATR